MRLDSIHNNSDYSNLKMYIFHILRHICFYKINDILLQWAQIHYEAIQLRKHKPSSSNLSGSIIIREKLL